jgi:hypothetical protein
MLSTGLSRAEAGEILDRALAMARRQGALSWELRIACSLVDCWQGTADEPALRTELATLLARFSEGAETADHRAAQARLHELDPMRGGRLPVHH